MSEFDAKMVVGLGNPGRKYVGSRHNIGFEVIAELARRHPTSKARSKFNAEIAEAVIHGQKSLLVCPLTFMNLSGQSVRAAVDFFRLKLEDLLVVCDDYNLPLGRIRLRSGGSPGGHNGLSDIIERLGTDLFSRLRLGIGKPPPNWQVIDYVLGQFNAEEKSVIQPALLNGANAVEKWIAEGIQSAMNQYNPDPNSPGTEDQETKKRSAQKPDPNQNSTEFTSEQNLS